MGQRRSLLPHYAASKLMPTMADTMAQRCASTPICLLPAPHHELSVLTKQLSLEESPPFQMLAG